MSKNPYIIDGQQQIKKSFCVYLDILGFRNIIIEKHSKNKSQEHFEQIYNILADAVNMYNDNPKDIFAKDDTVQYRIFSDNIVFGIPYSCIGDGEPEFGNIIMQVAYFQLMLATEGFFVRGGMTLGDLYIGEELVYGKALLDAYEIENTVSVYPRVVVSEIVKKEIKNQLRSYTKVRGSPFANEIRVDTDGNWFIDYLWTTIDEKDGKVIDEYAFKHKCKFRPNPAPDSD